MRYRTFLTSSQSEAIEKIKNELGPDAVIVSVKKIKRRKFPYWLIPKEFVEVVAAVDNKLLPKTTYRKADAVGSIYERTVSKELQNIKQVIAENFSRIDFKDTINQMRSDLSILKDSISSKSGESIPFELLHYMKKVENSGIKGVYARKFVMDLTKHLTHQELANHKKTDAFLTAMIAGLMNVKEIEFDKEKKVVCLVGPTGVGKTTTIAKLAANVLMNYKKEVAIITLDTYRIAAVEQLSSYAKIMNIPMDVAFAGDDVKNSLEKFKNYQFVFIDTAGKSQKDTESINELAELLPGDNLDVLLTLAANVKDEDIEESYKKFSILPIKGTIFTKLDEANHLGTIFNISFESKLPIYFLTTGQKVPDDIMKPEQLKLANLILQK